MTVFFRLFGKPTVNPQNTSSLTGLQGATASLSNLQATAAKDPKAAIRETAKQFEAIFMQELLKSMRASVQSQGGGMFDGDGGGQMSVEMLDQQYASKLSGQPGGVADMIARQLERQLGGVTTGAKTEPAVGGRAAVSSQTTGHGNAQDFVVQHTSAAQAAEKATGIPAAFILGQAAHESGWGQKQILNTDGSTSHNLFGIKAGSDWKGKVAQVTTTEYIDGRAQKVVANFRAYDSAEAAFKDYAQLLKGSARYSQVVNNADTPREFAQGLQKAGYATDPAYADKLSRVINTTLRLQRSLT
jgi:flagellar protein FlgJ